MIRIERADNKADTTSLFVGIKSEYPLGDTIWFKRVCASEIERNLLDEHLNSCLWKRMERIREVLYRIGWKHKASKRTTKWTSFSCSTDVESYEKKAL